MLPFLIGQLTVTKPDGTVVRVGGSSSDQTDELPTASPTDKSHTGAPSKHHASNSGDDAGVVVPIVAIVFVFLWLIIKALMAPFTQKAARGSKGSVAAAGGLSDEEQAVLVKLQRTLADMESRIESLETILIDEHRTKEKYGHKI